MLNFKDGQIISADEAAAVCEKTDLTFWQLGFELRRYEEAKQMVELFDQFNGKFLIRLRPMDPAIKPI